MEGLLKDRLERGRKRLEDTREAVKALCEPVEPPRDSEAFRRYFCHDGNDETAAQQLKANEKKRLTLYSSVAAFLRAYANLANEMTEAGYAESERHTIRDEVHYFEKVRQEIKLASGDYVDFKVFEPAMRHLLDNYMRAEDSTLLSSFDDMTLVELLIENGASAIESLPEGIRRNNRAVAETIENNVRRRIVDERAVNPMYYDKMSAVLDALIKQRREEAIEYEAYLQKVRELAEKVMRGEGSGSYPATINTQSLQAVYDNLPVNVQAEHGTEPDTGAAPREDTALAVDRAVRQARQAAWRGHPIKEKRIRKAIRNALGPYVDHAYAIFEIVKAQHE